MDNFKLNSKLESLLTNSEQISIETAPHNITSGTTFLLNGKTVKATSNISKNSQIALIKEDGSNTYLALNLEENHSGQVISSRTLLSRHSSARRRQRPTTSNIFGAVIYSLVIEETEKIEFWLKTNEFEKKIAEIDKYIVEEGSPNSQFPFNPEAPPYNSPPYNSGSLPHCSVPSNATQLRPPGPGSWRLMLGGAGRTVDSPNIATATYRFDPDPTEEDLVRIVDTKEFSEPYYDASFPESQSDYTLLRLDPFQVSRPGTIDSLFNTYSFSKGQGQQGNISLSESAHTIFVLDDTLWVLRKSNCSFVSLAKRDRNLSPGYSVNWFPVPDRGTTSPSTNPFELCDPPRRPLIYPLPPEEVGDTSFKYDNRYEIFLYKESRGKNFYVNIKNKFNRNTNLFDEVKNYLVRNSDSRELVGQEADSWRKPGLLFEPSVNVEVSNPCFQDYLVNPDTNIYSSDTKLLKVNRRDSIYEIGNILITSVKIEENEEILDTPISVEEAYCNPQVNQGFEPGSLTTYTSTINLVIPENEISILQSLSKGSIIVPHPNSSLNQKIEWYFNDGILVDNGQIKISGRLFKQREDDSDLYWDLIVQNVNPKVVFPLEATIKFSISDWLETKEEDLKIDLENQAIKVGGSECELRVREEVKAVIPSPKQDRIEAIMVYKTNE